MAETTNTTSMGGLALEKDHRFISVGGVTVGVEDFVNLWNGHISFPELSDTELKMTEALFDPESASALIVVIPEALFGERFPIWTAEMLMKARKYILLKSLINRYKKSHGDVGILRMHRVLAAISGDKMQFSSVGALVAALPGVQPSGRDAALVGEAVASLVDASDRQVNYVTEKGSMPVTDVIHDTRQKIVCDIMDMSPKKLGQIPLFILERVAFGQEPTEDDLRELSRLNNIGSAPLVTTIQLTKWASMLGGWGMFAHSIYQMVHGIDATNEFKGGLAVFTIGAYLMLLYPAKARRIAVSLASSSEKYANMYERLASKIEKLEKAPYGKARVLVLREVVRDAYSNVTTQRVDELCELIDTLLVKDEDIEAFNSFAVMQSVDYDDFDDVVRLLHEFRKHEEAALDLEAELISGSSQSQAPRKVVTITKKGCNVDRSKMGG